MNERININFGTIFKRSSCLNPVSETKVFDVSKRLDILNNQLKESKDGCINPSIKNSLRLFMENICNFENANKYYIQSLSLIQELNLLDPQTSNYILKEYTSSVLAYVEDLSTIQESVNRYNLTDEQKESIIEAANKYMIADRIIVNHSKISKRFNIVSEVNKVKTKGLRYVVENCCSMIDTYTINPYAKFNLCLEEISYILNREGIEYDKKEFVKLVTEYFLLRSSELTDKDIRGFRLVLSENCYINEDDLELVSFVTKDYEYDNSKPSINKEIQAFLINHNKSIQLLEKTIENCMNSTILDIRTNISKLIWLVWNIYRSDIFDYEFENDYPIYPLLFDNIFLRLQEKDVTKVDIITIMNEVKDLKLILKVSSTDSYEYSMKVVKFKSNIDLFILNIENLSVVNYSSNNLNALQFVNNESTEAIPLSEFKIFKFHNLVRASMNLDKFLKYKAKNIYDKGKKSTRKVVKKIKDVLFEESTFDNIYKFIGEDSKADICVAQYYIDENNLAEVHEFFEIICKEFNDVLLCENMDSIRCYYILNSNIGELRLKESTAIKLEEDDKKAIAESISDEFDVYIEQFAEAVACLESFELFDESELNLEERIFNLFNENVLSLEEFEVVAEALSFLNIDSEGFNLLSESFINSRYNNALLESTITESQYLREQQKVNNICNNWNNKIDVPLDIQLEAFQILSAILEAAPKVKKPKVGPESMNKNTNQQQKDDPDTKVDESRKNPFKGINLNSMKLYLEGLKKKMNQMSTKEKEISRNLDNNYRRIVKGMKDALVSDRREAIIKGSIIPSFSRCVKIAIAMAGLVGIGILTQNPLIPLLPAIAGFATSKKLTQRERILLLDEIETELQVIDKEISMAESENKIKKLRTLLKYKKDLQRQYQRIRYNIKVGKDILPGSASGIRGND